MKPSHHQIDNKIVLLTGGSGVLGQAIIEQMVDATMVCLVHETPVHHPNVLCLSGDISKPRFGFSPDKFKALAERLDYIIHSAAITDFYRPAHDIKRANVEGTQNILELAALGGIPVHYISTAFVHLLNQPGSTYELNAYEMSKVEAENVMRSSGLPYSIIRPSLIVGDSATGMISRIQGVHLIIDQFMRGLFPVAIASLQSYSDLIPQDWAGKAIIALTEQAPTGQEYWLTAGEEALSLDNIIDLCIEHAPRLVGRPLDRPKMISMDLFDRLIRPVFLPEFPPQQQRILETTMQFMRYLNVEQPFPTSRPELECKFNVPPLPDPHLTIVANLDYWAQRWYDPTD